MSTRHLQNYLQPGAQVGEFVVENVLPEGKGGMATVFVGKPRYLREELPEKVAVKVSLPENQKFLNHEVLFLKRLEHRHVVRIYPLPKSGKRDLAITTLKTVGQVYYYAMEYLPGGTLRSLLEGQPNYRLSLFQAITIGRQLIAALEHMHKQRIINLDIKPENILFRPRYQPWFSYASPDAVLCDFGAARAVNEPGLGDRLGSPNYLSPEQIIEASSKTDVTDVGYRADIFLLGIVLYEMVTGKRPFQHPGETIDSQFTPAPPHELVAGVSQKFSQLIMKALEKDPARRFQSASEMRQALETMPRGVYWSGLPRITVPFLFTVLLATAVYGFGPQLPSTPMTLTATTTHSVTMPQTITQTPAIATPTATKMAVSVTPTTVSRPTVTLAPSRTATFTPRPTATPTMTPDMPATPEF